MQANTIDHQRESLSSAGDAAAGARCTPAAAGRALVPIGPDPSGVRARGARYASAPFLAHLIAIARGVPQMRPRRRAAPADAAAVYTATLTRQPLCTGRKLRRSA